MARSNQHDVTLLGEDMPPVYTEYPTELPKSLPIGIHRVQPLVNITELQAHLKILGAIHKLKLGVQAQEVGVACRDKDLAWIAFVNKSVNRFYKWTSSSGLNPSASGINEHIVPPLDVLMVWHSYLLNPRAFYEDSQRMDTTYCKNLRTLSSIPLTLVTSFIDSETLEPLPASDARRTSFEEATGDPFDYTPVVNVSDKFSLGCPFCAREIHNVEWLTPEIKGFAQPNFSHTCNNCGRVFTKEHIGIGKFAEEVMKKRAGQKVYFSGTLLDPRTGVVDETNAGAIVNKLLATLEKQYEVPKASGSIELERGTNRLAKALSYGHKRLVECMSQAMSSGLRPRLKRFANAYANADLASLELVGAILRQGSFINRMHELGWTTPGRFVRADDMAPLLRCIARYHAFLDLMSHSPDKLLVPTLDIDLAWHTHQLKGDNYRQDTLKLLGLTPNHDDNVEAPLLSNGYDVTASAWRARFGVPYSVCGCIPDANSGVAKLASRLISVGRTRTARNKPQVSTSALVNHRTDLVSMEDGDADASHPSEHNAAHGNPDAIQGLILRHDRKKQVARSVANAKKNANKDPWSALQADRSDRRGTEGHHEAFIDPYEGYGHYYSYWGINTQVPYSLYGLANHEEGDGKESSGHDVTDGRSRESGGSGGSGCDAGGATNGTVGAPCCSVEDRGACGGIACTSGGNCATGCAGYVG